MIKKPLIRTMATKDLDRIAEIDTNILGQPRREFWEMKLDLAKKRSPISPMVAEMDGEVVGFIIGEASGWEYALPTHVGWIDTVGVDPAFQRKGIARMLMTEMINYMKKVGVDTIYTFINWRDWSLLQFCDAMGFKRGDMINLELKV